MLYYNIQILSDAKYSFEGQDVYPLPFLHTVLPVKGIANIKFQVFVYINKYNEKSYATRKNIYYLEKNNIVYQEIILAAHPSARATL